MAMGKRESEQQQDLFVMHDKLPQSPGMCFMTSSTRSCARAALIGTSRHCASRIMRRGKAGRRCRRASTFACC
jgi:hypothetical protein